MHERNKEVLKMAEMQNVSEGVRKGRWKFIGLTTRKEPNNDCRTALTWTPEGRRKRGEAEREREEREREKAGWKNWSEVQIAAADRAGWREHVSHGTKTIGKVSKDV